MTKIIDISHLMQTSMLITHIDKTQHHPNKLKQQRYYNKYKFYFDVIKTIITGIRKEYIITFPFTVYSHTRDKNGNMFRHIERRPII